MPVVFMMIQLWSSSGENVIVAGTRGGYHEHMYFFSCLRKETLVRAAALPF
jgi:hypothetical protein